MRTNSLVLNKVYDSDKAIYMLNHTQFVAYMLNGGKSSLVDIIPDKEKKKLIYVFEKNEYTRELYELWNKHELEY